MAKGWATQSVTEAAEGQAVAACVSEKLSHSSTARNGLSPQTALKRKRV